MKLDPSQLIEMAPRCSPGWAGALAGTLERWSINTGARIAMFVAQCAHESAGFSRFEENLNYSAERLMAVWPSRFPSFAFAADYARQPERIASYVYANRLGNGNEASRDGWTYRGRGVIQITGRANYRAAGAAIGYALEAHPTDAALPARGAEVAGWFWFSHGLNARADAGDFHGITRVINGGLNGLADRLAWLARARAVLFDRGNETP